MSTDNTNVDRRTFLKRAGITAAVSLSATSAAGTAAATSSVEARYADPLVTELEVERHASDVLGMLVDDGLLESADPMALPTRKPSTFSDVARRREGTVHLLSEDGALERIVSVRAVPGGVLSVTIEPGSEHAYAFFEPDDGSSRRLYSPNVGVRDVDTDTDCETNCWCISITCVDHKKSKECETCCGDECDSSYFCEC